MENKEEELKKEIKQLKLICDVLSKKLEQGIQEERENWKKDVDKFFVDFEKLVIKSEEEGNPLVCSAPDFEHPKRKKFIFSAMQEYYDLKNNLKQNL